MYCQVIFYATDDANDVVEEKLHNDAQDVRDYTHSDMTVQVYYNDVQLQERHELRQLDW